MITEEEYPRMASPATGGGDRVVRVSGTIAGATILGGAIGSVAGPIGTVIGAAVGAAGGVVISYASAQMSNGHGSK